MADFYKILGIDRNTPLKEIKKRYRELARKHHPDTNQGSKESENRFKAISEAYEVLTNKKKRLQYDQQQAHSRRGQGRGARRPGWGHNDGDFDFSGGFKGGPAGAGGHDPRDDFRQATEQQPHDPNMPTRGFDLQFMVEVPLATVALGGRIPYTYDKYVTCETCGGTGGEDKAPCAACRGTRQEVRTVTREVAIPPGVADQYTLRIPEAGGEGKNGGPPGDLLLKVITQPHPLFRRVKNDIHVQVNISPELAEHGGPLEVETLDAMKTIQVEEGTLTGEEHRIAGEGAAILWGKKRGDLVVKFHIEEA